MCNGSRWRRRCILLLLAIRPRSAAALSMTMAASADRWGGGGGEGREIKKLILSVLPNVKWHTHKSIFRFRGRSVQAAV